MICFSLASCATLLSKSPPRSSVVSLCLVEMPISIRFSAADTSLTGSTMPCAGPFHCAPQYAARIMGSRKKPGA
jgi:hypothetical protein